MKPPLRVCRGQFLDPHDFLKALLTQGYQRVPKVSDPGDCALRGGILDLFPEGFEAPVRIELDHQTVERIRSVHPVTGAPFLSHEMVIILPAVPLRRQRLRASAKQMFLTEEPPLDPFVDIEEGDLVVHVTYGIGRYLGLKRVRGVGGIEEHIVLEYDEEDRLYVPLAELHLIQKYIGFEGRPPKLSRLGSRVWNCTKELARRGAQ